MRNDWLLTEIKEKFWENYQSMFFYEVAHSPYSINCFEVWIVFFLSKKTVNFKLRLWGGGRRGERGSSSFIRIIISYYENTFLCTIVNFIPKAHYSTVAIVHTLALFWESIYACKKLLWTELLTSNFKLESTESRTKISPLWFTS